MNHEQENCKPTFTQNELKILNFVNENSDKLITCGDIAHGVNLSKPVVESIVKNLSAGDNTRNMPPMLETHFAEIDFPRGYKTISFVSLIKPDIEFDGDEDFEINLDELPQIDEDTDGNWLD